MENQKTSPLILEEQDELNKLIFRMDEAMLHLSDQLTRAKLEAKKAEEGTDAYGMLISAKDDIKEINRQKKELQLARDQLYEYRLWLDIKDEDGKIEKNSELKVGLHTYALKDEIFICSWKRHVCRHYILDNTSVKYTGKVREEKSGRTYKTEYTLKKKRRIKLFFDTVEEAYQLFPVDEKSEIIVSDEFLQELMSRRHESEFRNIVFSIQKQQGEIIQTEYKKGIIVQGCAGSGKSMIMMHRIPILLFDNPDALERNRIFIVTPSKAYIQMAKSMREQLEISDLRMGTIDQYYEYVLSKYNLSLSQYSKVDHRRSDTGVMSYVYSDDMMKDIFEFSKKSIMEGIEKYRKAIPYLMSDELHTDIISGVLSIYIKRLNSGITEYNEIVKNGGEAVSEAFKAIIDLKSKLSSRKEIIKRKINKYIDDCKKEKRNDEEELSDLDPENNKIAYTMRREMISSLDKKIGEYNNELNEIEVKIQYFDDLKKISSYCDDLIDMYEKYTVTKGKKKEIVDRHIENQIIQLRNPLAKKYRRIKEVLEKAPDPYYSYADPINLFLEKTDRAIRNMMDLKETEITEETYMDMCNLKGFFEELFNKLPQILYERIIGKAFEDRETNKKSIWFDVSPYIYLQIMVSYIGRPNARGETLICIDEAQNLAPIEYELIRKVNDNDLVLNLYGDVKQHFEESKGIDSWKEITGIEDYIQYDVEQNYRNARQITDFCNEVFDMDMQAINLPGLGVSRIELERLYNYIEEHLISDSGRGTTAIIVKNLEEANTVFYKYSEFEGRLNLMIDEQSEISLSRWNIMPVALAKELEFERVIAISSRMTNNEKYVCYTRAFDELVVFDEDLPIVEIPKQIADTGVDDQMVNTQGEIAGKEIDDKFKNDDVQNDLTLYEFFSNKGLEIIDKRDSGGYLWVIGDRSQIGDIVKEAGRLYSVSGGYASGMITKNRKAWYTRAKK